MHFISILSLINIFSSAKPVSAYFVQMNIDQMNFSHFLYTESEGMSEYYLGQGDGSSFKVSPKNWRSGCSNQCKVNTY